MHASLTPAAARAFAGGAAAASGGHRAAVASLRSLGAPRVLAYSSGSLGQLAARAAPRAVGAEPRFSRRAASNDRDGVGGTARGPRQPFGGARQLSGGRSARVPRATGAEEPQLTAAAEAAPPEKEQLQASAAAAAASGAAAGAPPPADSQNAVDAQAAKASASTKKEDTGSWLSVVRLVLSSVALALLAQWPPVSQLWARLAPVLLRADVAVPLIALPCATLLYRLWSTSDRFTDLQSVFAVGFASQKADAAAAEQRLKAELASQKADTAAGFASQKADAAAAEERLKDELASQKADTAAGFASQKADLTAAEQRLKDDIKDVKAAVLTSEKRTVDWAHAAAAMSAGHAAEAAVSAQTAQAAATAAQEAAADVARSMSSSPAAAAGAPTP